MNKLEDFTVGSEWTDGQGVILKFSHIDSSGLYFTSDQEHPYIVNSEGFIGFGFSVKGFKKVSN